MSEHEVFQHQMEQQSWLASRKDMYMAEEHYEAIRPSMLYKPKLSLDGNQWCALFGENLQNGVCGFGNSPREAYYDFDKNWYKSLEVKP